MYIFNITFFCEQDELAFVSQWIRMSFIPRVEVEPVRNARLALVVDVPGEPELDKQARSMSLQFEFDSMADYQQWSEKSLKPAFAELTRRFGEKVLTFTTLLQTIE